MDVPTNSFNCDELNENGFRVDFDNVFDIVLLLLSSQTFKWKLMLNL